MGGAWAAVPPSPVMWDCPEGVCHLCLFTPPPLHLPPSAKKSFAPAGTRCCPPRLASPTLVAVVVGVVGPRRRREWVGGRARAQGCDHLHNIGHDHLAGTHGLEPLGGDAVRVILNVQVRLDGHWPPAARGVDGDLFKLGAGGGGGRAEAAGGRAVNRRCPCPGPLPQAYDRGMGFLHHVRERETEARKSKWPGTGQLAPPRKWLLGALSASYPG